MHCEIVESFHSGIWPCRTTNRGDGGYPTLDSLGGKLQQVSIYCFHFAEGHCVTVTKVDIKHLHQLLVHNFGDSSSVPQTIIWANKLNATIGCLSICFFNLTNAVIVLIRQRVLRFNSEALRRSG